MVVAHSTKRVIHILSIIFIADFFLVAFFFLNKVLNISKALIWILPLLYLGIFSSWVSSKKGRLNLFLFIYFDSLQYFWWIRDVSFPISLKLGGKFILNCSIVLSISLNLLQSFINWRPMRHRWLKAIEIIV